MASGAADQQGGGVLVVGNVHLDRLVRLSRLPEPGETVIGSESWSQVGGKAANQAVAAARHAATSLVACVGDDQDGWQAASTLQQVGVRTQLRTVVGEPTGSSVALLDAHGENVGVILPGANRALQVADVLPLLDAAVPGTVVCQWESPLDTVRGVLRAARERAAPSLLNAAPWQDAYRDTLPLADHVVVNRVEAQAWTGLDPQDRPADLPFDHPSVVVTLGSGGALHYRRGRLVTQLPAPQVQARSTHGAGDHFVGVLAAHLATGQPMETALEHAVHSAAQFVQTLQKQTLQNQTLQNQPLAQHPHGSTAQGGSS